MASQLKSQFLQVLTERGYIHQCTDLAALDAKATQGVITGYIGFDATADSLHVGSLVQIMLLRRLQQTGHRPIVLMGGGTTKIGDPSGKDEARQLLTSEKIDSNIASIKTNFSNFLTFGNGLAMPSWSTMPTGWTDWNIFPSCKKSDGTSPSTAC